MDRECSFTDLETFVREELPRINADRPKLRAIFATYNSVAGYDSGPVWAAGGLTVQVANGGLPPPVGLMFAMIADPSGGAAAEFRKDYARQGAASQGAVESQIAELGDLGDGDDILAVVYAGVTAFQQSVEFVLELRRRAPQAVIVLVTCSCGSDRKQRWLQPIMESGIIDSVIETPECGGERTMGALLDTLIASRAGLDDLASGRMVS
jgi:hypothetical protein